MACATAGKPARGASPLLVSRKSFFAPCAFVNGILIALKLHDLLCFQFRETGTTITSECLRTKSLRPVLCVAPSTPCAATGPGVWESCHRNDELIDSIKIGGRSLCAPTPFLHAFLKKLPSRFKSLDCTPEFRSCRTPQVRLRFKFSCSVDQAHN